VNESVGRYTRLLGRYLGPYRGKATALGVLLLTTIVMQTVNPQFLRTFIDSAQAGAATSVLVTTALVYVAVGLVRRAMQLGTAYISNDLGWRATNALRMDLMEHALYLDLPFHKQNRPGQLIERIDGDVLAMANFFSQFVVRILGSGLLLVGILVALYLEDWRMGLGLTAFSLASLAVLLRLREHAMAESTAEREQSANLFGFIEERLAGVEDIRSNGGGAYAMRRFFECMREYTRTSQIAWLKRSVVWLMSMVLFNVGYVIALLLGATLYFSGAVTLGAAYLLSHYVGMLFHPIEMLTQQLQDLQKAGAGVTRVRELLATERDVRDGHKEVLPEGPLSVTFEDVSFIYEDGDQPVLHRVSFSLQPGTSLGLLGRTGSGKTTLSRLLFRFYDPTAGSVRIGGVDLAEMRLEALRRRVGLVTQDVQLFKASVRDNLTLFDDTIADERLTALLHELGLGEWLERLPDGLDTQLEAGGGGLSAGEAQLLALARVFLRDPGLVVLDEPSSRLDPATEHLIERAMDRLMEGRTAVVIAHRLGTVQRVDEIMIMDEGRVLEHGRREDLVADPDSRFSYLLQTGMEDAFA